ncbi:Superfamily II DNA or RNA helicase [Mucilaginibacter sp. OK268]|uniref:DEAD/DEAH box helicase family protein n=1 Tax=Mucilaginibacter sp. OK268 TaxID=1881048 RepID=UPI0008811D84|nr:DEAD/DEAH box helicase family protein [Mucilaginibacter sp. OK268]SDP45976.1 Superfamily II DNA or RNA helicase [Mucilaginibacter sp. OK268]
MNNENKFRAIDFPQSSQYSSDSKRLPLEFYETAIPKAETMDMVLGYFSTNAIRTLCMGFAEFIYNGGVLRIVTNHELTEIDKENLLVDTLLQNQDTVINIFSDLDLLRRELGPFGQHFFDCLKYLISQKRMVLQPVMHKPIAMSHYKKIILFDGADYLYVHGSANFTSSGIVKNGESFTVDKSWGSDTEIFRIEEERTNFNLIFNKNHSSYIYLKPDEVISIIEKVGNTQTELELLDTSLYLRSQQEISKPAQEFYRKREAEFKLKIDFIKNSPKFPFNSSPREYQLEAYQNWKKNNYSGLFAMATGTGKTITALNCALTEFNKTGEYHIIVLVPSKALLEQWESELKSFNFNNILKVGGGNNWQGEISDYSSNYKYDIRPNLAIIAINDSFVMPKFQKYYKTFQRDFLLIADEAHNLGAPNIKEVLSQIDPKKRIGLSATPKRIYDPEGTEFLSQFFKDKEPYCYSFTMERALKEGRLTNYYYYPNVVQLETDEQDTYNRISKELLKYFDFDKGQFKDSPIVEILLLERKRVIHKARQKLPCFMKILKDLNAKNKLKFVFTYVPEGISYDEKPEGEKLIYTFIRKAHEFDPNLRLSSYTSADSGHGNLLKAFTNGEIDIVFAMKMLDEGIDVPRTEIGIFASSTGNPRQYIQRRGRLLRTHKDKLFASIYDMIVTPQTSDQDPSLFKIEQNLLKSELMRVAYFASLSMNFKDTQTALADITAKYDIDIDTLIIDLQE